MDDMLQQALAAAAEEAKQREKSQETLKDEFRLLSTVFFALNVWTHKQQGVPLTPEVGKQLALGACSATNEYGPYLLEKLGLIPEIENDNSDAT